jgi:hypothetical protein
MRSIRGRNYTMTNQRYPEPTRRSVLASVSAIGIGAYGFTRFRGISTAGSDTQYTNYTLAETHGPELLVGWYSTVNGELKSGSPVDDETWEYDSTDEYIDDVESVLTGSPAIDVDNALPGDSGTLSVGLFVSPDSESGRVWLRLKAGDGSLAETVEIRMWYDTGIFGIGGCQGAENGTPVDTITAEDATLAAPGQLADGIEINPGIFDNGEINPGDRICVALEWSLPIGVGNVLQNASTDFDLEFVAVSADDTANPFGEVA